MGLDLLREPALTVALKCGRRKTEKIGMIGSASNGCPSTMRSKTDTDKLMSTYLKRKLRKLNVFSHRSKWLLVELDDEKLNKLMTDQQKEMQVDLTEPDHQEQVERKIKAQYRMK